MKKPMLSILQIWNLSFGFMGIQFGWGLQMANMSAIYTYLKADESQLPILWLAAPVTGLLVQPIVGFLSDRTWCWLGRRRPYFLIGAILASIALIFMPHSSTLWMAAGLLWVLDTSVNISMEPFRAFVADMLPEKQHGLGFTIQTVLIGIGAIVASSMPWILENWGGLSATHTEGEGIPFSIRLSFYIGACVLIAAVLVTIITTKEYPPENMEEFKKRKAKGSPLAMVKEIYHGILNMPEMMKRLAVVQFFSWLAFFCMWIYFSVAISTNIFGGSLSGTPEQKVLYDQGVAWGGVCFSAYNFVAFLFSLCLIFILKFTTPKKIHFVCLLIGGLSLISIKFIGDKNVLFVAMTGIGIVWASVLSMPYALLAAHLPKGDMGFYMGIFNFFIVLPQICVALFLGKILSSVFGSNPAIYGLIVGGVSMIIAALFVLRVKEKSAAEIQKA